MSKLNWFFDEDARTSGYEVMIAGQSFIYLRHGADDLYIPIGTWRKMMGVWQEKKWDSKYDTLAVTDECFES